MVNSIIQAKWCHEFRCHQNTRARDRIISFSQSRAELKGSSSHYKVKQRWLRSYDDGNFVPQDAFDHHTIINVLKILTLRV